MDIFFNIISNPIALALAMGLIIVLIVSFSGWASRRSLTKENQALREYLNTHASIHAKGSQALVNELEILKKQNENLRNSLEALKSKPGRNELRTLYLYDHAIRLMNQRALGFAPVWEMVLQEVEDKLHQIDKGAIAWVRSIIQPSLAYKIQPTANSANFGKSS
jgi:hypothetical protein